MAQAQKKRPSKGGSRSKAAPKPASADEATEESAAAYAKEAVSQWGTAVKLGATAVAPAVKRLGSLGGGGGGLKGKAADWALSHTGMAGRAASKLGLGSKLVGANGSGGDDEPSGEEPDSNGDESVPVPIQEAVTVAVPIGLAYRLATSFEDYPQFLDHAHGVDVASESEVEFDARLHGTPTRVGIEIVDVRENERIDWRGTEGPQHTGSVSFHELAPRLTHIELSVDLEPQGVVQRLSRAIHLSNHAVKTEMQRFKAFAELYEGDEDEEFEPDDESDEEPRGDDEPVDQEPADDEGPEDDEEVVDEDELDEDELVDEEELDEDEELVDEEELDEDEDEEPIDDEDIEDEEVVDEDEEIEDDEEALEEERAA